MRFNSLQYFAFLPVVFLVFYFIADKYRYLVLLLASICFYAALRVSYLLVVLPLVVTVTYYIGIRMGCCEAVERKKWFLWVGIGVNLFVLGSMKYLPVGRTFVSIGVSFYVFQAISYLIDVYMEIEKPELHFGYFALYLGFFPKLLQGPIERAGDLLPQLKANYSFNYDNMRSGMLLFTWGLFKKVVVADRISGFVNVVYDNVSAYSGLQLITATYMYAFQLYFDFSAYTDMALGTAILFNIKLTQNFNSPYLATSVIDFWRRWHISFSRWILDYIFAPLQMQWRNWKQWGTVSALIVTFLISGIWHGVGWGFIIWGLLHGFYMACSVFYRPFQSRIYQYLRLENSIIGRAWRIAVTFNLICFAWIFFRATNINDALLILKKMFSLPSYNAQMTIYQFLRVNLGGLGIAKVDMVILILVFIIISMVSFYNLHVNGFSRILNASLIRRWSFYIVLVIIVITLGTINDIPYLYFQF